MAFEMANIWYTAKQFLQICL